MFKIKCSLLSLSGLLQPLNTTHAEHWDTVANYQSDKYTLRRLHLRFRHNKHVLKLLWKLCSLLRPCNVSGNYKNFALFYIFSISLIFVGSKLAETQGILKSNNITYRMGRGTRWRSWLRHCTTSQNVAGSIQDGVIGIFHWHNPSGRTVTLASTQPLTEMSTRSIS